MRTWTLCVSVVAHAAVIGAMIVAPIFATGALPEPRRVTRFSRMTPIDLPTVPVRQQRTQASAEPQPVPLVEPIGLPPETVPDVLVPSSLDFAGPAGNGVPPGEVILGGEPAAPPSPTRVAPLPVGGVIRPPKKVAHVDPMYPRLALAARVEGVVILQAVIDESGAVRDVAVLRSIALLDSAAVEAVRQWRFTPTLLNGVAVPVVMTVTVGFNLK